MKSPRLVNACACDSGLEYAACCAPYHAGALAPTPEALMRSRYSAYAGRQVLYLLATWHSSRRPAADEVDLDPATKWLGLRILQSLQHDDDSATVEFVARYRLGGGSAVRLHEVSRFVRENGAWLYVDGEHRER